MSDHGSVGVSGGEAPVPHHKRCGRQPTHYGAGQFSAWPSDCKTPGAGGMLKETTRAVSAPAVYLHNYFKHKNFSRNLNKKSEVGNFLLSQEAALQVPSADTRLTAGFGMLPGIPTLLWSPTSLCFHFIQYVSSSPTTGPITDLFLTPRKSLRSLVPVCSIHYCTFTSGLSSK